MNQGGEYHSNNSFGSKKVVIICCFAALCCAAYFQLVNSRVVLPDSVCAQEISEAVRNEAVAHPHSFGIEIEDVTTLRTVDSVPSARPGYRHVYVQQEVNGIPISNTLLSTIVKQGIEDDGSPGSDPSNSNLRTSSGNEGALRTQVVKIVSSKQASPLIKNAQTCIDTNAPRLTAEEALSFAVNEVLGVNGTSFRRRVLEEEDAASERQKSVFEADDLLQHDTPCQLAYWSVANNYNADNCNIRLSWSCILKPSYTSSMEIFIDASDGNILHIIKFGQTEENNDAVTTQQTDPSRRRLSTFSAVPYPNENPCPSCAQYSSAAGVSELNVEDIEPLSLVMDPEFLPSSPKGWLTVGNVNYDKTQGNNARAAFNVNEGLVDFYNSGEAVEMTDRDESVFDYSNQDVIPENMLDSLEAAVVNAFYWTNIVHDILYQYGFTEESGNFQEDNFGLGGKEGDSVVVEVKETFRYNNAVFLPTIDGDNPIMILFLFVRSNANVILEVADEKYTAAPAAFGPTEYNVTGAKVIYSGGIECDPPVKDKDNLYKDAIVLIDRGTCVFTVKVNNAQKRGAAGVIVIDNVDGPLFPMQGSDTTKIPSVLITKKDGDRLKQSIPTSNSVLAVESPDLIIRDAAFDNGIIIHEYCHGLTTRLTGGPSTQVCVDPRQAKETGSEGWSDFCTLFITATNTTDRTRTVGSFASWSLEGIRLFPYSTNLDINPSTYSYINAAAKVSGADATHFVGTIWATVLWDMYWAIIDFEEKKGRLGFNINKYDSGVGGSNIAMQLVVEGLKTQPCNPSFVDSRDAILTSDLILYDEEYKCVIWEAFARRGLGESAVGSRLGTINVEEAFDVPKYCLGPYISLTSINNTIVSGDSDDFIDNCEILKTTITLKNTGIGNFTNVQLVEVTSNSSTPTVLNQLPMPLIDLPERASVSINIEFIVDGLKYGESLELEAKISAAELTEPISISILFDEETSTNVVIKDRVTWDFEDGANGFIGIDGYFSLEASRTVLTVDGVTYYSPCALFGPQNFTLVDLAIIDGEGLECEPVNDDKFVGSVVLIERGECNFVDKIFNAQNRGARAVVIINNLNGSPQNMVGNNEKIQIPSVMVSISDGRVLKQNVKTSLASLSFDATVTESLSSFLGRSKQCNRVRSPMFLLRDDSTISMWVSYGIKGITAGELYDRANVGLFDGQDRVTITPDGGEKYNSNDKVETLGYCPSPGDTGWREDTGLIFKQAVFSPKSLQVANDMYGQMVQLDVALATGLLSFDSFFSIQKVELENVGILVADEGDLCAMPSVAPSQIPIPSVSPSQVPSLQSSTEPSPPSPFEILRSDTILDSVLNSSVSSSSMLINATIALVLVAIFGVLNLVAFA